MNPVFSQRTANLVSSPIREILSVIDRPGMISFAGGLPSPDSFPKLNPGRIPARQLQYGPSEGEPELRRLIAAEVSSRGRECSEEQVLILSGSQQGIDIAAKLFIDPETCIALESPTYLAALQVFGYYGARYAAVDPAVIHSLQSAARLRPRLLYSVPTFQNPSGRCYTSDERRNLADFCDEYDITLFEDDPYRDLVYEECERRPVCSRLTRASWIYQGSFSKSLAPGLRLGYMVVSPDILPYAVRLKQAADLHSSRVGQWLVCQQLLHSRRTQRITKIAAGYKAKRDRFHVALQGCLGHQADWEVPPGGLFFWLRLRQRCNTQRLLREAIARGVAFMPGEPFFPVPTEGSYLRLNFSHASAEQAERGLGILAEMLQQK